jgi:hypothetical protein
MIKAESFDLRRLKLDSVHVCSNMAKLSRIQLFHKTTKIFLKNLKKNHKSEWELVNQTIRDRYLSADKDNLNSSYNFFGQVKVSDRDKNLSAMAEDIHKLLTLFENNQEVSEMDSFKLLSRLFSESAK